MEAALTTLIPSLVPEKIFGEGEFVSVEVDNGASIGAQFSSVLALINLKMCNKSGEIRVVPLVVKVQNLNDQVKDTKAMFYNEVMFYREILPVLDANNERRTAKMFYGVATCGENPEKDVLILENLKVDGFELPRIKSVFLDFDHIAEAMRAAGKLHSWSYSLKNREPKKFQELTGKLKKRREFLGFMEKLGFKSMKRGIIPLLKDNIETEVLKKFLKAIESVDSVIEYLTSPHEPFGVITHGDYCKNNVLYKYDDDKPIDCTYFDFQFTKYACPVSDISFFLYMHTTVELREKHWDDFLKIYWKSVEENVHPNVQLPTYGEFLKYFATKAVFGYYPSSFFLPFLLFYDNSDLFTLSEDELVEFHVKLGGEEGTKLINDVLLHLVQKRYLQSFLDVYDETF